MTEIPQAAIEAAAAWWASRLGNCTHNAGMRNVSEMELTVSLNAETVRGKYSAEQAEAYRAGLVAAIGEHLRTCRVDDVYGICGGKSSGRGQHVLRCDYDPDDTLRDAAERAGIDLDSRDLPAKSSTILRADAVKAKEGYGAPHIEIWAA